MQLCIDFVSLQIEMKGVIIKVLAVVMTIWYSMSIIGFDVHTCSGSGRSFVSTFIEGLTCEDIHPEHSCSHVSCCPSEREAHSCCDNHHHDDKELAFVANSCCSTDYQVLQLTGIVPSDDQRGNDFISFSGNSHAEVCPVDVKVPSYIRTIIAYLHESDSGHQVSSDRQAALGIWRI